MLNRNRLRNFSRSTSSERGNSPAAGMRCERSLDCPLLRLPGTYGQDSCRGPLRFSAAPIRMFGTHQKVRRLWKRSHTAGRVPRRRNIHVHRPTRQTVGRGDKVDGSENTKVYFMGSWVGVIPAARSTKNRGRECRGRATPHCVRTGIPRDTHPKRAAKHRRTPPPFRIHAGLRLRTGSRGRRQSRGLQRN